MFKLKLPKWIAPLLDYPLPDTSISSEMRVLTKEGKIKIDQHTKTALQHVATMYRQKKRRK